MTKKARSWSYGDPPLKSYADLAAHLKRQTTSAARKTRKSIPYSVLVDRLVALEKKLKESN